MDTMHLQAHLGVKERGSQLEITWPTTPLRWCWPSHYARWRRDIRHTYHICEKSSPTPIRQNIRRGGIGFSERRWFDPMQVPWDDAYLSGLCISRRRLFGLLSTSTATSVSLFWIIQMTWCCGGLSFSLFLFLFWLINSCAGLSWYSVVQHP